MKAMGLPVSFQGQKKASFSVQKSQSKVKEEAEKKDDGEYVSIILIFITKLAFFIISFVG